MIKQQDWLRVILQADGLSDYRNAPPHRIDWLGKAASLPLMAAIGFIAIAAGIQIAESRPQVTAERDEIRQRVMVEQERTQRAERDFLAARGSFARTQDAVRPDLDGNLAKQLDTQAMAAAFVALRGPGVLLVLDDAKEPTLSGTTDLGRVIDRDVQHAVNGLWAAGAEAVSVDGIRLTGRTAIRNAGNAILVDYKPVSAPIEIRALGPANRLSSRFRAGASWAELVQLRDQYGLRWSLNSRARLIIPAGVSMLPALAQAEGAP